MLIVMHHYSKSCAHEEFLNKIKYIHKTSAAAAHPIITTIWRNNYPQIKNMCPL